MGNESSAEAASPAQQQDYAKAKRKVKEMQGHSLDLSCLPAGLKKLPKLLLHPKCRSLLT